MRKLAGLILAVLLTGCAAQPAPAPPPPPPVAAKPMPPQQNVRADGYDPAAEQTCKAKGGSYRIGGLLGRFYCPLSFSDGGKDCTDKADCQGACLAQPGARMGEAAIGKCAATDSPFGCNAPVNKGVAGPVLCVD
jgi:hypothetical protein